ncbi:MAG: sugar phosphate isomerase/epimerase, partial [Verrucomicrobiota bacterium]
MATIEERLSLSTCWCSALHTDGYEMISEIRDLGFRRTELSHGIRMSLVPGIIKALDEGLIKVSSVHNFCPLPASVNHAAPNLFQPSAKSKTEITAWHRYSKKTIEFAAKVRAPHIVMHSGSVQFRFRSPTEVLEDINAEPAAREAAWYRLVAQSEKRLPQVISEYQELLSFAEEHGVVLGAENREGILELPLDTEFVKFLQPFDENPKVRYWHDTGHAEIKHQLD